MDRLIVLEQSRIVEQGSHDELLRLGGHYALLWEYQAGGFLPNDGPRSLSTETAPPLDAAPVDEMRAEEQPEPNTSDAPLEIKA